MHFVIDGIVAARDKQPYLRFFSDGEQIGQLTIAEARKVAADIQQMAARTEADAMLVKFFEHSDYPKGAAEALLIRFRDFRLELDSQPVEGTHSDPETGATVG